MPKTEKSRLWADFALNHTGGWGGGRIKKNGDDWKFKSYKGTNLGYDMMCESVNCDQEEKVGDVLNGNRIINLKNLITNIYIYFGVQIMCTGEGTTDKIGRGKRCRKVHWLCWGLFSANSIRWTEGNKGTALRLKETKI